MVRILSRRTKAQHLDQARWSDGDKLNDESFFDPFRLLIPWQNYRFVQRAKSDRAGAPQGLFLVYWWC